MKKRRNTIVTFLVLFTLIFSGCTPTASPDKAAQSAKKSYTTEDGLPPLEDDLKQLYQDAETIYLKISFGNFQCDTNQALEKYGYVFYKVDEDNFDSYDSFKAYLSNYFTKDFISRMILAPEDSRFTEGEDGGLYMLDAGRGSNISYAGRMFHFVARSENQITFTATAYYSNSEEGYEGEEFFTAPENISDFSTEDFTFTLVKEGDTWKFDQFFCFF